MIVRLRDILEETAAEADRHSLCRSIMYRQNHRNEIDTKEGFEIMERKYTWEKYDESDLKKMNAFNEEYKAFLSACKTERECNDYAIEEMRQAGYRDLEEVIRTGGQLKAGDRVYRSNRGKGLVMFQIGTDPLENGANILGAHIDSPRLDLKQNPVYEDGGFCLLNTHYYGGIKKYQWVNRPLALHGVVAKKDGSKVMINIGEKEDDPVFGVMDLLIHLAAKQMEKKAGSVVEGENLDVLVGSEPLRDKEKDEPSVKDRFLKLLQENYGIEEEDFLSAEVEVVPAGKARDLGLDRSMILSYGHDDRVCAFPSYRAMMQLPESVERTCICLLVDKEEIGSMGATGMQSRFFEETVGEVLEALGINHMTAVGRTLRNSTMLSSDVSAGFDPLFPEVMDKDNCAYLGKGLVLNKYTGVKGKTGSNDANAEYIGKVRRVFDDNNVYFQTAELGKVDEGGGGTIAYIMANYGMDVIDSGVAVLGMHAPNEVVSKADVYEALRGYIAFLKDMR